MGTEVSKFFGGDANVPAAANVAAALKQAADDAGANLGTGGMPLLKFSKGDWNYGASNTDVEPGSEWAANPMSVKRGYVAWKDRKPLHSVFAALGEPAVKLGDLQDEYGDLGEHTKGKDKGEPVTWDEAISIEFMCVSGEDVGTIVKYEVTSYGGRQALTELTQEMARAAAQTPDAYIPVVTLDKDSYIHKEHGKTFTPEINIKEWAGPEDFDDIDPVIDTPAEPEPEPEPKAATSSRRKKAAQAAEEPVEDAEVVSDEPATPPPGRRRRRPS